MRTVRWGPDDWNNVHMGMGIKLKYGGYLLVVDFSRSGNNLSGPYTDISQVDHQLARGRKIVDAIWGAMYPPR